MEKIIEISYGLIEEYTVDAENKKHGLYSKSFVDGHATAAAGPSPPPPHPPERA